MKNIRHGYSNDSPPVIEEEKVDGIIRLNGPPQIKMNLIPLPSPPTGEYAQWTFRSICYPPPSIDLCGSEPVLRHTSAGITGSFMSLMATCGDVMRQMEEESGVSMKEKDGLYSSPGAAYTSASPVNGPSTARGEPESGSVNALRKLLERLKGITGRQNPNDHHEDWPIEEIREVYRGMSKLRAEQPTEERPEATEVATLHGSWHMLDLAMTEVNSIVDSLPREPAITVSESVKLEPLAVRTVEIPQGIPGRFHRYGACALRRIDGRLVAVQLKNDPASVDPQEEMVLLDEAPDLYSLINKSALYEACSGNTGKPASTDVIAAGSVPLYQASGASVE